MDALYRADQSTILKRAYYYLHRISRTYGTQTKVTAAEADAQMETLKEALRDRTTDHATRQEGSVAVDAEELKVCLGLYRAYTGLLHAHFEHPEVAYSFFPFPNTVGTSDDANLPALPPREA